MRFYWLLPALALGLALPAASQAACCYFSAKNADILQPAQKVFITWDPSEKVETFTVQRNSKATPSISAWSSRRRRSPS